MNARKWLAQLFYAEISSRRVIIGCLVFIIACFLIRDCVSPQPAKCNSWGCWGGPCMTSAACVAGCHCINGTCG